MPKFSRKIRRLKKGRRKKIILGALFFALFLASWGFLDSTALQMATFDATGDSWSGTITIGGLVEDGNVYMEEDDLPSSAVVTEWSEDSLDLDLDGNFRLHGCAAPLGSEINTDLPWPEEWSMLDGYPTAKPKIIWEINDNIRHIDVNGDYLTTGVPSVVSQENGLLVETYYYSFSLELSLTATRATEHDFYWLNLFGGTLGTRYFYDISPIRGLYLLPEIATVSNNESITDIGSDLATYGGTQWKFYDPATGYPVSNSDVEDDFAVRASAFNRDFFLAGGDSGAGLNIFNKVDEYTNQFAVGFVKVGLPGYIYGNFGDALIFHTVASHVYSLKLAIPLRASVIVVYDLPYDAPLDVFYYGEEGSGDDRNEEEYWFTDAESALADLQMKTVEDYPGITAAMFPYIVIGVLVAVIVVLRKMD